jgi:hypothetical protein
MALVDFAWIDPIEETNTQYNPQASYLIEKVKERCLVGNRARYL